MKAFLMGTAAAVLIAVVAGVSLTVLQSPTSEYYSTDNVRLSPDGNALQ